MASDVMNPVQCNICEDAVAKFHCNTCGDTLCATCKAHHLKSKGTKHHKIVPYAEKLNPKHLAGLLCPKHQANAPKFWCDKCDVPICNSCITNEHKGHPFSDITVLLAQRRDEMLVEMKTLRDKSVGEWEGVLKQTKKTTADFLDGIDKVSKELVARAKAMHEQVETILAESQRTLQNIKESVLTKLRHQDEYLDKKLRELKEDVASYQEQLTHGDPNALIQFKPDSSQSKMTPPSLETASPPVFLKGQNDTKVMLNMFGQLSAQVIPQKNSEVNLTSSAGHLSLQPLITLDISKSIVPSAEADSKARSSKSCLIPNPPVQSQFDVSVDPSIACADQGVAWVQTRERLQLMDSNGLVKQTINISHKMEAMALTSDGDLFLADYWNNCIKCVSKQKKITTPFKTTSNPWGLCCLHNDEIAVTFFNESIVTVFNRKGQIRQMLDHIKCRYPRKIAVNKLNKNIYICDHKSPYIASAGKVIAVGADGQILHKYSGQGDSKIIPVDVCTDQWGHVLIADRANYRVHILDQEGRFIQYILNRKQGLVFPTAIDVDKEGYLWVGGNDAYAKGCVKVVRYLQ